MPNTNSSQSEKSRIDNYLRMLRKKAGLSQCELGKILGYLDAGTTSRHERSKSLPPFLTAISYEVLFRMPVSAVFRGVLDTVELTLEKRLQAFEAELEAKRKKGTRSVRVNQKLAWLAERRNTQLNK